MIARRRARIDVVFENTQKLVSWWNKRGTAVLRCAVWFSEHKTRDLVEETL